MVDIHEVFSTSITLDEVERANRCASGECPTDDQSSVRIVHAGSILPLKHEHDRDSFIPFSPILCAFYAGPQNGSGDRGFGDSCIYVMRVEQDGSHSLVNKLDCPQLNQKANCTPVLFYLNQGEARRLRHAADLGAHDTVTPHAPVVTGEFKTSIQDIVNKAGQPDDDKTIALIYKAAPKDSHSVSYTSLSFDEGRSFVTPRLLVEDAPNLGRGPVRTKPFLMRKGPYAGRIIFPCSVENKDGLAFADFSDDDLRTIAQSNAVTPDESQKVAAAKSLAAHGVVLSALFEDLGVHRKGSAANDPITAEDDVKAAKVHMMLSASASQLFVADSDDGGANFSAPYPIDLYNCNMGIDVISYQNRLLCLGKLVTDPDLCDFTRGAPLSLFMSHDGKKFTKIFTLEEDPRGIYTSPCLQVDRRHHLLYVSYTDHRKAIKLRIFRLMLNH